MLNHASVALLSLGVVLSVAAAAEVWPMPQSFNQGPDSASVQLSPAAFTIQCSGAVCPDPLAAAFKRYFPLIFIGTKNGKGAKRASSVGASLTGINVVVAANATLKLGVDESYNLTVPVSGTVVISAANQWGALHGLESFSQLVAWAPRGSVEYSVPNVPISITDYPRFQWRGALIDSSRHYLSVSTVLRTIDALSQNKFNVLHWHFVDDQSWPVVFKTYPNFSELGTYDIDAIYQPSDVAQVVQYAWERGVMVIPEYDSPAHATVWGVAYPELTVSCPEGQTLLNPTGPVFTVLDGLLAEYDSVFTYGFVHIGGDEVQNYKCWDDSAAVQAFCKANGIANSSQLRSYYEAEVQTVVSKHGARSIAWEEVFDGNFTVFNDTVINVWLSADELGTIVRAGLDVIYSYGYYLDVQVPPGDTHWFWVDTWQNFYLNEPTAGQNLTPAEEAHILGGEASQWGEQCDDAAIDTRMWPRACATAERLWSAKNLTSVDDAEPRIEHQRCRMLQRGIKASPIRPSSVYGYCYVPPV